MRVHVLCHERYETAWAVLSVWVGSYTV